MHYIYTQYIHIRIAINFEITNCTTANDCSHAKATARKPFLRPRNPRMPASPLNHPCLRRRSALRRICLAFFSRFTSFAGVCLL